MSDRHDRLETAWEAAREQERTERDDHIVRDATQAERLVQALSTAEQDEPPGQVTSGLSAI